MPQRHVDLLSAATLKHLREQWWDDAFTDFVKDTLQPRPGQRILDVGCGRGKAQAKAGDSRTSIFSIVGVLLLVYVMMLQDPAVREGLADPLIQAALLVMAGWMFLGYQYMQGMIESVG